jgi:membrane protease YdiL (CAAX protease family)
MSGIDSFPPPEDANDSGGYIQSSLPPALEPSTEPPPARVIVHRRPFPLHPNFWWGILWCIGLELFTQVPGAIVFLLIILGTALLSPSTLSLQQMADNEALMRDPVGQIGLAASIFVSFTLIIFFSWLMLRILAGRDWRRQVALRWPRFSHFVLVLVVAPAFVVVTSGLDQFLGAFVHVPSFGKDLPGAAAFLTVGTADLLALALAALFVRICRIPLPRLLAGQICLAVLLAAAAIYPNLWAYAVLRGNFQGGFLGKIHGGGVDQMVQMVSGWPLPIAILAIGVMPGVGEELWCRAFLGRGLVGKHGLFWGVLGTSFLFGAIHVDPRQGTMAMVAGIMLHYIYLTTRSLLLPMLLHFLNNSMAVTLTRIPDLQKLDVLSEEAPRLLIPLFSGAVVLVAGICWALYQTRACLVAEGPGPAWQPPYPGVALPPPDTGTRLGTPAYSRDSLAFLAAGVTAFAVGVAMTIARIE